MLKDSKTLLVVVALAIASNLFKTAYVFKAVSFQSQDFQVLQWAYAIGSMVIIEFSVLVLLSRGKGGFSYLFAFCTFLINLFYFNSYELGNLKLNFIELVFSFLLPLSVVYFSELYAEEIQQENSKVTAENGKVTENNRIIAEQNGKIEELSELAEKWKLATSCECGFVAQSPNGLIAHKRSCIKNGFKEII